MEKKKRDYMFLLLFMILSYISLGIVEKLNPASFSNPNWAVTIIPVVTTMILWYIFLFRITSNFYSNRWVRGLYAALLIFQLTSITYINSHEHTEISELVVPATISYLANLISFTLVFYILLKDIFSQRHDLTYSLLGASNIYFLIPLLFCYSFSIVAVQNPSLVHADPYQIKTVLMNSFDYSWFVFAGLDYPGEGFGRVIQSMAILESIAGNLFIVFIIGRLMSK